MKTIITKKIAVAILAGLAWHASIAQHQLNFSQYFLHPSFINVASIGGYNNFSAGAFYRNQWTGFEGSPTYFGFDVSNPLAKNQALGLTAMQDKVGANTVSSVSVNYAIKFKLTEKNFISFGIAPTAVFQKKDLSMLNYRNPDPAFSSPTVNVVAPNVRFGAYFFSERYYIGLSSPNVLRNDLNNENGNVSKTSFDFNDIHLNFHAGYAVKMTEEWDFLPSVLLKYVNGAPMQVDVNAQLQYKRIFGFGLGYRSKDMISGLANVYVTKDLRLGYAFDWSLGQLSNYNSGTHELMLVLDLFSTKKKAVINSPRF